MKRRERIEAALDRVKGVSNTEVYPMATETMAQKYRKAFSSSSTFVILSHYIKTIFGPGILALPAGFMHGGLTFSIFGFLALLLLVAYNMKRLTVCAAYLSEREQKLVKTYDDVAFVAFSSCSTRTKGYATAFKLIINIMFFITLLHSCIIFNIFVSRNVEALLHYHFPNNYLDVHYLLFFQVLPIMSMCSVRDLKFISPFSFVGSIFLFVAIGLSLGFFLIQDIPNPRDRLEIGTPLSIAEFFCTVLFTFSGFSIVLTLKSSMSHPEHMFAKMGIFNCCFVAVCLVFIPFGYLGYLKYGKDTKPSVMLNLPLNNPLSVAVKVLAIFSVFLSTPIVFYLAFNIIWNNYLKKAISVMNVLFAEFFFRYCLITFAFCIAFIFPDLGTMIILKGAIFHSHLEVTFPAILDYVTYYPEKGTGKYHWRLFRVIFIALTGTTVCVTGVVATVLNLNDILT